MASESGVSALGRFLHALREEKIPFLIAGMTAAVLQGVPVTTSDVDFWIGTSQSENDAVLRICHRLGAVILTDHIAELPDGAQLHFAYSMGGAKILCVGEKARAKAPVDRSIRFSALSGATPANKRKRGPPKRQSPSRLHSKRLGA
jgi:hypothetical protein